MAKLLFSSVMLAAHVATAARAVDSRPAPAAEVHPEPASEAPIDLKTAVERALARNPAVLRARELVRQSDSDRRVTRSVLLPNLSLLVNGSDAKQPLGNLGRAPFNGQPYQTFTTDLRLTQPLVAFGALSSIDVASFTIEMNKLDLEVAERTLTSNVIQQFNRVLLNRQLLANLGKIQAVVEQSLSTAQRRLQTGRGQLLDVLQVKTQIALLKPQIEDARNQWESAANQLATSLSEPDRYHLNVVGRLRGLRLAELDPLMPPGEARLPELEKIQLQTSQLAAQKHVSFGKHLPSLNLQADLGSQSFNTADFYSPHVRSWTISLALVVPIFSGLSSVHEQRSLSSQQRQIDLGEHDLLNTIALNQVQSRKALETTEASLTSAEAAADLANQSLREAERNYRLATIDFMQFLTVEQANLQADSSLENIRFNNVVAVVNYFVAKGQPLGRLIDALARVAP